MTDNSRRKRLASLLIAVALLINIGIYLSAMIRQGRLTLPVVLIALMLMTLAAGAVYATYRKTQRRGHVAKLEGEYLVLYERVVDYLILENISKKDRAEIQEEWLDIILSAQQEERKPESLYGNDFEASMDVWVRAFGSSNRKVTSLIDGVMFYCVFLVFLQVINYAKDIQVGFFQVAVPNSILIYIFLVTFVMVPLARRYQRKGRYLMYLGVPLAIFVLYVGFSEGLDRLWPELPFALWYTHGHTQAIPSPLVLFVLIALAVGAFVVKRLIRRPL